jgi:hypothetical protein
MSGGPYSYTNDLGEPMMDGAAIRTEWELDQQAADEGAYFDDDYAGSSRYDEDYDPEYD